MRERSLLRYCAPRFWLVWGLYVWMQLVAKLPVSIALATHRTFGRALRRVTGRQARIARRNLELCFPELSSADHVQLEQRYYEAVGMSFAECSIAWFGSDEHIETLFDIRGMEHLYSALARGRGVILYTGHFTTLEICGRAVRRITPHFAAMMSPRSNSLFDEIQRRGRLRVAHEIIPRDSVRMMVRSLRRNSVVWYAPDRLYDGGRLVPFFHQLAMTNLATGRLAKLTGAAIVPFSYRRLDGQARYEVRFHPQIDAFPTDNPIADTRRLVTILESFIRDSPEQYVWSHKRYKGRPFNLPDLYANEGRSGA